jgi:hypothetical protein
VRTAVLGFGAGAVLALAGAAYASAEGPDAGGTDPGQTGPRSTAGVRAPDRDTERSTRATGRGPSGQVAAAASGRPAPARAARAGGGRLTTIYQGTHFAIPNPWRLWLTRVEGEATFTENSTYDLLDEDQKDWNKLTGITWTPLMPNYDAAMVVWRYNLDNSMFEVGPFFNDATGFVFPTPQEVISVPAGAEFGYAVDYDGIAVTYGGLTVRKARPEEIVPNFFTSALITGWFGGSEVAPRTISYHIRMRPSCRQSP